MLRSKLISLTANSIFDEMTKDLSLQIPLQKSLKLIFCKWFLVAQTHLDIFHAAIPIMQDCFLYPSKLLFLEDE